MSDKDVKQMGPSLDELRAAAQAQGARPTKVTPGRPVPKEGGLFDPTRDNAPIPTSPIGGVGAGYARNHEVSGTNSNKLSPQTAADIEALHRQQVDQKRQAEEKVRREEENSIRKMEQQAEYEVERQAQIGAMEAIQAALSDNPWLAPGMREAQEEAVAAIENNELSIARILMDRAQQLVPIADGLYATVQTIKASEDLLVKRMLRDYVDQLEIYFDTIADMLRLAIGVDAIGDIRFPPLVDPSSNRPTPETVTSRLEALLELPIQLIAALAINYTWFDVRVKKLLVPSSLKNG